MNEDGRHNIQIGGVLAYIISGLALIGAFNVGYWIVRLFQ